MIRKHYFLLLAFAGIFALNSCQKEDLPESRLTLLSESMGNTKVAVEGRFSHWVSGETVRINNATKVITVSDGVATVDNSTNTVTAPFHAIYPASLCPETDLASVGSVTVTLPDSYQYRESGDLQQLDIPMAASNAEGEELQFKHLTGALAVKITNNFGGEMSIKEVIVESSVSQISGSCEVNFADVTNQTANDDAVTDAQRRVRMLFESTALNIANGSTEEVILPVMPVSGSNKFTVTVNATYGGKTYTFSRTQGTGGSMARNELGYVPVTMSASNEHVGLLIRTASDYNALVSQINAMTTGTATVRATIDGTIDFGGATVTPINLNANHVIINGTNNAKLTNLSFGGAFNYYGMTYSNNVSSVIEISDVTIENATMAGSVDSISNIGTFCAYTKGDVTLTNCTAKNITVGQASQVLEAYIGGLIGFVTTSSANTKTLEVTLNNCKFIQDSNLINPEITRLSYPVIGGLIGHLYENNNVYIKTLIQDCQVSNSTNGNFELEATISQIGNTVCLGGLIGYSNTPSLSANYLNLSIVNSSSKIDFKVTKLHNNTTIRVGGFIGAFIDVITGYPTTTYWSGNSVSGIIRYTNVGTCNVRQVVGTLADKTYWNGRVTTAVSISTL